MDLGGGHELGRDGAVAGAAVSAVADPGQDYLLPAVNL